MATSLAINASHASYKAMDRHAWLWGRVWAMEARKRGYGIMTKLSCHP
jgi:hypothetical protein